MRGYPQFSFWISITLVKIYIPYVTINRSKNTIELVGTVLNRALNNWALVDKAISTATKYKNKWAVNIFNEWQTERKVQVPVLHSGGMQYRDKDNDY